MNKEYLREWYLTKVEDCIALAVKAKTFDEKERFLIQVENYKKAIGKMNKEYLREWYLAKVKEYADRAAEVKQFERKERYFNEVENYKNAIENLE